MTGVIHDQTKTHGRDRGKSLGGWGSRAPTPARGQGDRRVPVVSGARRSFAGEAPEPFFCSLPDFRRGGAPIFPIHFRSSVPLVRLERKAPRRSLPGRRGATTLAVDGRRHQRAGRRLPYRLAARFSLRLIGRSYQLNRIAHQPGSYLANPLHTRTSFQCRGSYDQQHRERHLAPCSPIRGKRRPR